MKLPAIPLSGLAVDMQLIACEQVRALAAMEGNGLALHRAGREADCDPESQARMWLIYETELLRTRRLAAASEAAHEWFRILGEYEAEIRALIPAKQSKRSAA